MAVSIKRENFRGKYYIIVRDSGRFAARRRWNNKFNVRKGASIWKSNKTLYKNISKRNLKDPNRKGFVETTTDYKEKTRKPPKDIPFWVTFTITIGGKTVRGSSKAVTWDKLRNAENEAMENMLANLSYELFGETDINEAEQLIKGKEHLIKRKLWVIS